MCVCAFVFRLKLSQIRLDRCICTDVHMYTHACMTVYVYTYTSMFSWVRIVPCVWVQISYWFVACLNSYCVGHTACWRDRFGNAREVFSCWCHCWFLFVYQRTNNGGWLHSFSLWSMGWLVDQLLAFQPGVLVPQTSEVNYEVDTVDGGRGEVRCS